MRSYGGGPLSNLIDYPPFDKGERLVEATYGVRLARYVSEDEVLDMFLNNTLHLDPADGKLVFSVSVNNTLWQSRSR